MNDWMKRRDEATNTKEFATTTGVFGRINELAAEIAQLKAEREEMLFALKAGLKLIEDVGEDINYDHSKVYDLINNAIIKAEAI